MKTIFLDRDGTIIKDPEDLRVTSIEKIELFPDTIEALKHLAENDFNVIIITNQAGIAEGRIDEEQFWKIQNEVLNQLKSSGVQILKTYMSPHGKNDVSEWKKPGPGMLLKASEDFDLNLADIYMVGDNLSDITAGARAGTKTILVKTANQNVEAPEATYTAQNLLEAVQYATSHS